MGGLWAAVFVVASRVTFRQALTQPSGMSLRYASRFGRATCTPCGCQATALLTSEWVGLSVHAAARICFAAHGRQIVMSSAVRAAVIESLADGVSLRSLGAWRFRGLPEPVDLFQVDAADLLADFPPLRSAVPAK